MSSEPRISWLTVAIGIIIGLHAGMLVWISCVNSPNLDELAHLPAGISHWEYGRFDLYRVNPPLVRMMAALPVMWTDPVRDWTKWETRLYSRSEFWVGRSFVQNNELDTFRYFRLARFACIPFSVIGCFVCFRWAADLYGWRSGLLALLLYASCPNAIAWGASITPDAASASMGLLAMWTYWRWLNAATWGRAGLSALTLGLALLTKSIWIFLLLIYPLIWTMVRLSPAAADSHCSRPSAGHLAAILVLAVYVVNLGYGFEESFTPLQQFSFISEALSGAESPPHGANRFAGTTVGVIPVPLPANYLRGIDVQRYDFETGKWSYLRGEARRGGWWYYYLYGLLVKTPLGTLGLMTVAFLAAVCSVRREPRQLLTHELILLAPAIFVIVLVSSQTGFNRHMRYVLPAMPFLYIFMSRIARCFRNRSLLSLVAGGLLVCGIVEGAAVLPHSMSFFNIAAGGPRAGPQHLLDSNVDWGQDLLFLKRWYENHPEARPLHAAYFADWDIPPSVAGIEAHAVPRQDAAQTLAPDLSPGWYAVSVNYVRGYHYFEDDEPVYRYFAKLTPVDHAGYSIAIYRIDE